MEPLDALWHLLNFFGPAVGTGFIAAMLAKVIWRRELMRVGWLRLGALTSGCAAVVSIVGLTVLGHDGRMVTYAAMVLAVAFGLWWFGLRAPTG